MEVGSIKISCWFRSLVALASTIFVTAALLLYTSMDEMRKRNPLLSSSSSSSSSSHKEKQNNMNGGYSILSRCNLFSGKWVYDSTSVPVYSGINCSFMDEGMGCDKYGRHNLSYQFWRWQPHDCDLPRFNAMALLKKLRNKRVVYVGDSLNRNQWVSMVCLLDSNIPPPLKYVHFNGSLVTFKAIEFNVTVDFYWSPLLVESNCNDPSYHRMSDRIIRVEAIENHAKHWSNADLLVFNSYIWWRSLKLKLLWGSFDSEGGIYEDVEMLRAYEMTLKTWSDWVDIHIDQTRTNLFFVSMSPTHNRAEEWGMPKGGNCYNETEPIPEEGYWGMDSDRRMMRVVETTIAKFKCPRLQRANAQYNTTFRISKRSASVHLQEALGSSYRGAITEPK